MSKGGRFAKNGENVTEKKKTGGLAKALVAFGVVLVLVAAGVVGVTVYQYTLQHMAPNKPTVPPLVEEPVVTTEARVEETEIVETTEAGPTEPTIPEHEASGKDVINILLVGNSAREDEPALLADTIILATVNKLDKTLTLTSFLRDTWVDMPDYMGHTCDWNRINVPYALGYSWAGTAGAMEMTNMTLNLNFGINVDHNVEVDLNAFMEIVNIMGGVRVPLLAEEAKYLNETLNKDLGYNAYSYEDTQGQKVSLDGMSALYYARMRHSNAGDSDIERSARQRTLITSMIKQLIGTDYATIQELANTVLPKIVTNMEPEQIKTYMWEILPLLPELTIQTRVCPDEYWSPGRDVFGRWEYPLEFSRKNETAKMRAITEADVIAAEAAAAAVTTEPTTASKTAAAG